MAAVATAGAGKAVGEDAAFEVLLKRFAHIGLGAAVVALPVELACAGQIKPGLVVLGHGLVQQRALGVARVVELGLGCSRHEYCANTQYSAAVVRARKAQSPIRCRIGLCEIGLETGLFLRRQVGTTAVRHLGCHADALTQRGVWVDGLANIHRVGAHLDGQCHFADHVARMRADHAATKDLAVAMGFGRVVEQQFGDAFVAAVGNRAAGSGPGEQASNHRAIATTAI